MTLPDFAGGVFIWPKLFLIILASQKYLAWQKKGGKVNSTTIRPSEVTLETGGSINLADLAAAIGEHSRATGTRIEVVLEKMAKKELVPVLWSRGGITLVFNSPNGL